MPRRAALPSALALALLAACAPSGDAPRASPEPRAAEVPRRSPRPTLRTEPTPTSAPGVIDDDCGAISFGPGRTWEVSGERFDSLRRGWHPRPEHGRPVGMRRVEAPFELPGFEFWQVQVSGPGRAIQPCATRKATAAEPRAWLECEPAWVLVRDSTPEARPRTNEQWARLVGALDGASAVYSDEETLDRCVTGLRKAVREAVPPLRTRWVDRVLHATFVERIDVDRDVTLLVVTTAKHDAGRLDLVHEELLTIDRGVAP
jgi:hypothetical protein